MNYQPGDSVEYQIIENGQWYKGRISLIIKPIRTFRKRFVVMDDEDCFLHVIPSDKQLRGVAKKVYVGRTVSFSIDGENYEAVLK